MDRRVQIQGGEYQQWFLIASPRHPFLRRVIQKVIHRIKAYHPFLDDAGRRAGLVVTGPIAYTLAIEEVRKEENYRLVDIETDFGIHYTFFGDPYAHHQIYAQRKQHYGRISEPLVDTGLRSRFAARIVAWLRDRSVQIKT
jgi:hypothetical protein